MTMTRTLRDLTCTTHGLSAHIPKRTPGGVATSADDEALLAGTKVRGHEAMRNEVRTVAIHGVVAV